MDWWNSFEAISKVQTGLAVLLVVLGFVTLGFKLRGDQLRKVADSRRVEGPTHLDRELEPKTEPKPEPKVDEGPAQPPGIEDHPREAEPIHDTARHFPREKLDQFMRVLRDGMSAPTPLTIAYVNSEDGEPRAFAAEIAGTFGGSPENMMMAAAGDPPIKGISIQDSAEAQMPSKFASNLMAAFEAVGFKCTYGKGSPKPGVVCVLVGLKE